MYLVGMASTARLGLKRCHDNSNRLVGNRRNGLYSPFGIETLQEPSVRKLLNMVGMASTARLGLKHANLGILRTQGQGRNGLYSPFGIETCSLSAWWWQSSPDRKSVVSGKSVDLGGRRIIKKKTV